MGQPWPQHQLQPRQQRPRRRGPAAQAKDAARRTAWFQDKEQQTEADMNAELCPDTETASATSVASSNELVDRFEAETLVSDISNVITSLMSDLTKKSYSLHL